MKQYNYDIEVQDMIADAVADVSCTVENLREALTYQQERARYYDDYPRSSAEFVQLTEKLKDLIR